jgi:hypothetical protein
MNARQLGVVFALLTGLGVSAGASAVTLGQKDTFEDGTTGNWVVGLLGASHPAPPVNVSTGGPTGVDDNYLLLSALGSSGAGNRLSVINLSQWTGDYLAAGVTAIVMDLNNLGPADLSLRLLFADPSGGPPTNLAFSTQAVVVPAGSGWTSVVFPIASGDLTAGSGTVAAALMNTTEMRLFHSPTAVFPGPAVIASLGVDNIQAVPAPASLVLLGSALGGLGYSRRRRHA